MSAWCELIEREQMAKDVAMADLLRAVQHADKKGYKQATKRLREHGR